MQIVCIQVQVVSRKITVPFFFKVFVSVSRYIEQSDLLKLNSNYDKNILILFPISLRC